MLNLSFYELLVATRVFVSPKPTVHMQSLNLVTLPDLQRMAHEELMWLQEDKYFGDSAAEPSQQKMWESATGTALTQLSKKGGFDLAAIAYSLGLLEGRHNTPDAAADDITILPARVSAKPFQELLAGKAELNARVDETIDEIHKKHFSTFSGPQSWSLAADVGSGLCCQ